MSMWPVVMAEQLTWIDAAMTAEIDRLTIQYARVSLFQMMENAGRSLAEVVKKEFAPKRVVVLVGSGGNGGGGLVVQANATLTLCLPKEGMRGRDQVGQLFLADISVPAQVVTMATGHRSPPFDRGPILRVID